MDDLDNIDMTATMEAAFDRAESAEESAPVADEPSTPQQDMATLLTDEPAEATETDTETTDHGTEEADTPDESQPGAAPARWSAEEKAAFDALPREAQELVLTRERSREAAFTQKTQELAEQRKTVESLESVLAPRRQQLAAEGMTDAAAIEQLFQISDYANRDPAGFMKWFSEQRGLQPGQQGGEQPPVAEDYSDEWVDPETAKLHQRLQSIEQGLQAEQARQQQAQQAEAQSELQSFIDATDESDARVHPHYEAVKPQMAALLGSGAAKDLKHAYEMAVWSNADTRQIMMEAKATKEQAERVAETKKAAAAAKKARGTQPVSRQQPVTQAQRTLDDMEKTMSEAYDRATGA